jgi:hypothetical protein
VGSRAAGNTTAASNFMEVVLVDPISGVPLTPTPSAGSATLNITAPTVVKASPGRISKVAVIVAGSATGTVNDCLTTGAAAVANQVGVIPTTVGSSTFDWPCAVGIVIVPGTGQTLSVSFN